MEASQGRGGMISPLHQSMLWCHLSWLQLTLVSIGTELKFWVELLLWGPSSLGQTHLFRWGWRTAHPSEGSCSQVTPNSCCCEALHHPRKFPALPRSNLIREMLLLTLCLNCFSEKSQVSGHRPSCLNVDLSCGFHLQCK